MIWAITIAVITFILGYLFGRWVRKIAEAVDELYFMTQPAPQPKVGPTLGSYNTPPDPLTKLKPTVHVVTPKSPDRLEWERQNRKPDILGPRK
jgi:hypothetical protein